MRLLVGLGNPTPAYAHTRHNVGFDVLDLLAHRFGVRFKGAPNYHYALVEPHSCYLLKPMTYMNLSGEALEAFLSCHAIRALLVVHDDLDLPLGALRFKARGGSGGHNGLKSLQAHYPHPFYKMKIGIGRGEDARAHVLEGFEPHQEALKKQVFAHALEALCFYLECDDFARMQARFTRNPHKLACDSGSL
ncbi:aminoacyl-tRNA hydrolase [Helicobacter vulpis]|uniref:aminoacyl-tRNA hydrolase n=1 Tax=Helicobacter vulpis TaxID=2316076 RepID=UPI000EAC055F|nr:aminoacyl-tRNA hydrolase [Helicobacter vulpis]